MVSSWSMSFPSKLFRHCPGSWHCHSSMKIRPPKRKCWILSKAFDHPQLPYFDCYRDYLNNWMGSSVNSGFLKKGKMMFRLWRCFLRWYTKTPSQNSHPRSWGPGGPWLQASKIIETCCCWSATRGQLWFGAFCDKGDMVLPRFWKTRRVAILNCPVDVEELGWCENLRCWWSSGEQNHVQWRICTRMLCVHFYKFGCSALTILESRVIFVSEAVFKNVSAGVHSSTFKDLLFNPLNKHGDPCVHIVSFCL